MSLEEKIKEINEVLNKKPKKKRKKKLNKGQIIRKLKQENFNLWSQCVRVRDGKKCVICGSDKTLQAHHCFVRAALSLRTRFILDNGICVCYKCHLVQIHKYGEKRFLEKYIKVLDERVPYFRQMEIYRIAENKEPVTIEELQDIKKYLTETLEKLKQQNQQQEEKQEEKQQENQ